MRPVEPEATAVGVLAGLCARPWEPLIRNWNWKSALLSSLLRSSVFFGVNLGAGLRRALAAMLTEFVFRAVTAGWYGAVTQAFRRVRPVWRAVAVLVPVLLLTQHSLELLVHWMRGTPRLAASIGASFAFTLVSTTVSLALMRKGRFLVGAGSKSLLQDLAGLPSLACSSLAAVACSCKRLVLDLAQEARRS